MTPSHFDKPEKIAALKGHEKVAIDLIKELGLDFVKISDETLGIFRIQPLFPVLLGDGRTTYQAPTNEQVVGYMKLLIDDFRMANISALVTAETYPSSHIKIDISSNERVDETIIEK